MTHNPERTPDTNTPSAPRPVRPVDAEYLIEALETILANAPRAMIKLGHRPPGLSPTPDQPRSDQQHDE